LLGGVGRLVVVARGDHLIDRKVVGVAIRTQGAACTARGPRGVSGGLSPDVSIRVSRPRELRLTTAPASKTPRATKVPAEVPIRRALWTSQSGPQLPSCNTNGPSTTSSTLAATSRVKPDNHLHEMRATRNAPAATSPSAGKSGFCLGSFVASPQAVWVAARETQITDARINPTTPSRTYLKAPTSSRYFTDTKRTCAGPWA